MSLTREVYAMAPFVTEKGFFILNSYNILKNQDFSINYFIPLNLQIIPNFISHGEFRNYNNNNFSVNLKTEKTFNLQNDCNNLISEYLIRKLRLPSYNTDLFDLLSKSIEKELVILSNYNKSAALKNQAEKGEKESLNMNKNLNLTKLRVDYYLNKLKYKENPYDDYKVVKIISAILDKFTQEEENNSRFEFSSNMKNEFKTVCEICNDTDLVYNQEETGYICKNDHFFPCCCITKYPLICLAPNGEIVSNSFFKCNFCELFYEAEKSELINKYKKCVVCMNYLIKF